MDALGGEDVWGSARAITLAYLVFGVGWIVLTDRLVTWQFGLSAPAVPVQLAKGLLFVAGTATFVYVLLRRRERALDRRAARNRSDAARIDALRSDVDETEGLLGVVMENVVDTILLTDEAGDFTYVCPNVHYIFGYSHEAVREMGSVDALLGDRFPPANLEEGTVLENVQHEVVDADGDDHSVLVTVKSVDVEAGSVLYTVRDVTELTRQEERFRAYVEHSSDVLTVLDDAMAVEYVSPSVERILGHDPDDVVGRDALEFVHPEDRDAVAERFESIADRPIGTTGSIQYRTRRADGTWAWTESRVTTQDRDTLGAFVVNTRDVTELREREGRLSVLDRVLRHNIRNKLNIVLGAAGGLEDTVGPEDRAELDRIVDATEDLLGLSEKARRFGAAIRGESERDGPIDLAGTARRVVDEKRREYPDVEIGTAFPSAAWVSAHESIDLALAELIDNAVDHAEDGGTPIQVEIDAGDDATTIAVEDLGPGIPEMDREVVLRGEESQLEHGTYIGLWLVRWTIDNSDGSLAVRENEPTGTRIEATLPAADAPDGE